MFTFPKHLKGNRIPPPMKMRAIEAQKKLEKQEEETKPQLKGKIRNLFQNFNLGISKIWMLSFMFILLPTIFN